MELHYHHILDGSVMFRSTDDLSSLSESIVSEEYMVENEKTPVPETPLGLAEYFIVNHMYYDPLFLGCLRDLTFANLSFDKLSNIFCKTKNNFFLSQFKRLNLMDYGLHNFSYPSFDSPLIFIDLDTYFLQYKSSLFFSV